MADDSKKTATITGLDALPMTRPNSWVCGGLGKHYAETVEAAASASIGTVYRFFRVGSNMRMAALALFCDALSAGAGDIGLYRTAADGGAVVDADFFASAVAMGSALNGTDVTFEAASAMDISKITQRIWEVLGLTADPGVEYDVCMTLTTAITNAGTISLRGTTVG